MEEINALPMHGKVKDIVRHFESLKLKNDSAGKRSKNIGTSSKKITVNESEISLSKGVKKKITYQHPVPVADDDCLVVGCDDRRSMLKSEEPKSFELSDVRRRLLSDQSSQTENFVIEGYPYLGGVTAEDIEKEECNTVLTVYQNSIFGENIKCEKGSLPHEDVTDELWNIPSTSNPSSNHSQSKPLNQDSVTHDNNSSQLLSERKRVEPCLNHSLNKYQRSQCQESSYPYQTPESTGSKRLKDINKLEEVMFDLKFPSYECTPEVVNGWKYSVVNQCIIDVFLAIEMANLHQFPYLLAEYQNYHYGSITPYKELANMLHIYKEKKFDLCRIRWIHHSNIIPDEEDHSKQERIFNLFRYEGPMVFSAFRNTMNGSASCHCPSQDKQMKGKWEILFGPPLSNGDEGDLRFYTQHAVNKAFTRSRCSTCMQIRTYRLEEPPPCILVNLYAVLGTIKTVHLPDILSINGFRYRLGGAHVHKDGHCTATIWNDYLGLWMYYDNFEGKVFKFREDPYNSLVSIAHYILAGPL